MYNNEVVASGMGVLKRELTVEEFDAISEYALKNKVSDFTDIYNGLEFKYANFLRLNPGTLPEDGIKQMEIIFNSS